MRFARREKPPRDSNLPCKHRSVVDRLAALQRGSRKLRPAVGFRRGFQYDRAVSGNAHGAAPRSLSYGVCGRESRSANSSGMIETCCTPGEISGVGRLTLGCRVSTRKHLGCCHAHQKAKRRGQLPQLQRAERRVVSASLQSESGLRLRIVALWERAWHMV